jgi:four helix bundle protein
MSLARRLSVWEKAHALSLATYRAIASTAFRDFPGLVSQLQRAVVGIAGNINEGALSETPDEFDAFLGDAISAARELDYLLLLASDLGAITKSNHAKLEARTDQVSRMLAGLRGTVRRQSFRARSAAKRSKGAKIGGAARSSR